MPRWFALLWFATPLNAQQVATSPAPNQVAVTVYRAPDRPPSQPPNLSWLNGFALITEQRQVSIPAGESDIRFEGVAGGILPESAIVTGLPGGVVEKNQDAYLLSPGSLVDAALGRRVHLRRTSIATGAVRETEAVVRSGADGAVLVETDGGIEALRCSGMAETIRYDSVPPGLSAKPTLSVRVRSERASAATVTLSYLASGFDWQANYVAELAPDGSRMKLFAWLTLANADETSFPNADTQAVAGRLNRSSSPAIRPRAKPLRLQCWPAGTTSDVTSVDSLASEEIIVTGSRVAAFGPPPPPPPPPPPVVSPAMVAQQEALGDLKLYRIPEPVTVAAKSQKQVAFLQQPDVRTRLVYRQTVSGPTPLGGSANRVLIVRNEKKNGLGVPLPAGRIVLFDRSRRRPVLVGSGYVDDKAIGEEVEFVIGTAVDVQTRARAVDSSNQRPREFELVVSNARPVPVSFEADLDAQGATLSSGSALGRRNGRPLWSVTVPANGSATLRYRLSPP